MTTGDLMSPLARDGEPGPGYAAPEAMSVAPLWRHDGSLMPEEPKTPAVPHRWRYAGLREQAMRIAGTVSPADAQRRVLMLVNPASQNPPAMVNTLFAGVELVMPGERVRPHRPVAAALRLVIEGSGAYTTANGEVVPVGPADLVLTAGGQWHEHFHPADTPIVWLDGLDYTLMNAMGAGFVEPDARGRPWSAGAPVRNASQPLGGGLSPAWWRPPTGASRLRSYPWSETERRLARLAEAGTGGAAEGIQLEYTNPFTGGPVFPTISCKVSLLRAGFDGVARQHTASTIYHVIRGSGATDIDGVWLNWTDKDIFAVPGWSPYHHHVSSSGDAVLFGYNDEPVLRALGVYRDHWLTSE